MLIGVYSLALFVSAFLLFWMEPLFTKMVLPLLGGSPAVWNTAIMFFQVVLLAGYGYAYFLSRVAKPSRQFWIHGAIVLTGLAFLPLAIVPGRIPPSDHSPILWLIGLLAVSVGWPFFALSASSPLLQAWFGQRGHRLSADPYFLYTASNLGSLAALLAFSLMLEPSLTLAEQSRAWMVTYAVLVILVGACALPLGHGTFHAQSTGAKAASPRQVTSLRQKLVWIALAFVSSSLLLGVTSYITTDIAPAPLLWIIPLALYLLSFVVAFSRSPLIKLAWALKAQAAAIVVTSIGILAGSVFGSGGTIALDVSLHLLTFFLIALVCHTELANRRPDAEGVTEFYFCISIGGAAGGIFNALVAPLMFSSTYEYYLVLAAACALRRPVGRPARANSPRDFLVPVLLALAVAAMAYGSARGHPPDLVIRILFLTLTAGLLYSFTENPARFALGVAGVLGSAALVQASVGVLHQERNFFGVKKVEIVDQGTKTVLVHGTTWHGAEFIDTDLRRKPLLYYARSGPVGQFFTLFGDIHTVGVIGLGTGALVCYRRPGQEWTFYEIDGAIERIARDPRYFHYLEDNGADTKIILGDGRLSIQKAPNNYYDVIVIDAFSSDSIPVHLLTKEALSLYLAKLKDHGIILFHISNRSLLLAPVVATLVESVGAVSKDEVYHPSAKEGAQGATVAEWVAIARRQQDLGFLDKEPRWKPLVSEPGARPWTDDFSNIVSVIRW